MDWDLLAFGCLFLSGALFVHVKRDSIYTPRVRILRFGVSNTVGALSLAVFGMFLCYHALPDAEPGAINIIASKPLQIDGMPRSADGCPLVRGASLDPRCLPE